MSWFYREFGARVREARGKSMSQDELARRVGLSRPSVANVERGAQRVPLHMLVSFAEALGVAPDDLLPVSGEAPELSAAARGLPEDGQAAFRMVLRKARSTVAE